MKYWKSLLAAILIVGVSGIIIEDAMAKPGRGGGGFRSSSSRSSPSRSSPSRSPRTSSSRKSSSAKSTAPKRSAADQKLYGKAKASGTAYSSKSTATSAFKQKHASQYKSTYASKPASRPAHVPEKTTVGGTSYNVTYNQQHGGYGYMGSAGSWIMYNAMTDAVMLSALMGRNNYYYDTAPVGAPVAVRQGRSWILIFFSIGALVVIIIVGVVIRGSKTG